MGNRRPEINVILAEATEQEPRHQAGTILPFEDGLLLLAYSHFYDRSAKDDGPAHIVGRWSRDSGETWGEPSELQENIGRINCMTPSLLRLPSGRVLLEFMRKDAQIDNYPEDLPRGDFSGLLHPMVKSSDDEGATWRMGSGPLPPHPEVGGYAEPIIVETKDGKLKMWLRNKGTRFHVAISDDDGDSWRLHSDWGPNAHNAPCMVRRIPDTGDLLIIWNNNQIRTPLNCGISTDDGETWQHIKELEPMTEWPKRCVHAYPSLALLNGNAHITYYEARKHSDPADTVHYGALVSLRYRRLPIGWFYE